MAGAIAGTALLDLKKTKGIDIVTLTVNNSCNLSCPHCYLHYDGEKGYIENSIVDKVLKEDFRHLAIVGEEPLYNKEHSKKTSKLIERAHYSGKTISIITNGLNIQFLDNKGLLKFVDISLDGGPDTYKISRKYDYETLMYKICLNHTVNCGGIKQINALHTLYKENIEYIDDMVKVKDDAPFDIIMFSPYLETKNQGKNYVHPAEFDLLLEKLVQSKKFMDANNTLLNIDLFHAKQYNVPMSDIKDKVSILGLTSKIKLFETDLLREGVVRVTYDGFVLSPEESLHTAHYSDKIRLNDSLSGAYTSLVNSEVYQT